MLSPGSVLGLALSDLKERTKHFSPSASASRTLPDAEREHILEVLKQTDGTNRWSTVAVPRSWACHALRWFNKMRETGIERDPPVAPVAFPSADWRAPCRSVFV